MGSTMSNNGRDVPDSSSDDEPDFTYLRRKINPGMNCELDAVTTARSILGNNVDTDGIASGLSDYEKVSLIYLLNDDPDDALMQMEGVVDNNSDHILPRGFTLDNHRNKQKIIEALCIIQNYEILKNKFGEIKSQLIKRYIPLQRCSSLEINKTKKCLYRLFEDMSLEDTKVFMQAMKKELRDSFKSFPHLEMFFTYLETIGFISRNHFEGIEKALMAINKEAHYQDLQSLNWRSNQINLDQGRQSPLQGEEITSVYQRKNSSLSPYHINPDTPGVVLIIDNEYFYTECEDIYKDQIEPSSSKLADRMGTKYDSDRLIKTFKKFNFRIIVEKDLTHQEMLEFVYKVAHKDFKEYESSLFICILSHGSEGKVIGSNSIPVAIIDIKKQLQSPNLEGKPKVLIIQSCQGVEIQTLTTDCTSSCVQPVLQTDAPKQKIPSTLDFLEIWSTVPGYASIRNIYSGTWFIQTLCDVIESHKELNLIEICQITRQKLLNMEWKDTKDGKTQVRVMVCETRETLVKALYLPLTSEETKVCERLYTSIQSFCGCALSQPAIIYNKYSMNKPTDVLEALQLSEHRRNRLIELGEGQINLTNEELRTQSDHYQWVNTVNTVLTH